MSGSQLYAVEMDYQGHDPERSSYCKIVYEAAGDTEATTFAEWLASDWTESEIYVGRFWPAQIPSGYRPGDTGLRTASSLTIAQWRNQR